MSHEDARVENRTSRLHRAIITTVDGQVVDQTLLYDSEDEALEEGTVLIKLYREKATGALQVIGYISPTAFEDLKAGRISSTDAYATPFGPNPIPVYIKVNDAMVTVE